MGTGSTANPERQRFIDRATITKVIDACPNAEWRLLVALSRYARLRVPSEPLRLRWRDVDLATGRMLVHSPKTEHHAGKATRMVPIFPELRPYLEDAHELAVDGAEFVLPSIRKSGAATGDWRSVNVGTQFGKIIKRAGLVAWPRASSRLGSATANGSPRNTTCKFSTLTSTEPSKTARLRMRRRNRRSWCPQAFVVRRNLRRLETTNPLFCRQSLKNKGFANQIIGR